jgi:hypothetical protein
MPALEQALFAYVAAWNEADDVVICTGIVMPLYRLYPDTDPFQVSINAFSL